MTRNEEVRKVQLLAETAASRPTPSPNRWPDTVGLRNSCFSEKAPHPFSTKFLASAPHGEGRNQKGAKIMLMSGQLSPPRCQGVHPTQW